MRVCGFTWRVRFHRCEQARSRRSSKPVVVSRSPRGSTVGRLGTCRRLSDAGSGVAAPAEGPSGRVGQSGVPARQPWSSRDRDSSSLRPACISLSPARGGMCFG